MPTPEEILKLVNDNTEQVVQQAILNSITAEPDMTIGEFYDVLDSDNEGSGVRLELFRKFSFAQIADALKPDPEPIPEPKPEPTPAAQAPQPLTPQYTNGNGHDPSFYASHDEEEEELEEENEEIDDLEDEVEDEPVTNYRKTKKKTKKSKKKATKKAPKKYADNNKGRSDFSKRIVKFLKENDAYDEESAWTSEQIRNEIGGDAAMARDIFSELIDANTLDSIGQARGTRYYLCS